MALNPNPAAWRTADENPEDRNGICRWPVAGRHAGPGHRGPQTGREGARFHAERRAGRQDGQPVPEPNAAERAGRALILSRRLNEIGKAACRESVCLEREFPEVHSFFKKKTIK